MIGYDLPKINFKLDAEGRFDSVQVQLLDETISFQRPSSIGESTEPLDLPVLDKTACQSEFNLDSLKEQFKDLPSLLMNMMMSKYANQITDDENSPKN